MQGILVALVLIGGSALSWSADLKGTMDEDCCGTSFSLRVLHTERAKAAPEKEIVLRLYQGCPGHLPLGSMVSAGWQQVEAKVCEVGSSQCEPAAAAKIQLDFLSRNGKHASGSYRLDLPNAEHQEGKFAVKRHHIGPRNVCL